MFRQRTRGEPIIINEFKDHTKDGRAAFDRQLFTRYQPTDVLSNIPKCGGNHFVGEHYKGMECPICRTKVESTMDQELESLVWLKTPIGVKKLINPMVWIQLTNHFKKGKFNVIQWLCDTTYQPPSKTSKIFEQVKALNIKRGYNNFVTHFMNTVDPKTGQILGPGILEKLLSIREFRKGKRAVRGQLQPMEKIQELLVMNSDCIFLDYLPIPNRTLLVVEDTSMSTYVDSTTTGAIAAIKSMIGLDDPLMNHDDKTRENRVVRCLHNLALFYLNFNRSIFSSKEGVARKHIFGTRCWFSFRSVISSLTGDEHHEELHIPWGVGIGLLQVHLISKLEHMGWSVNRAKRLLNDYARRYHPLIDALFMELIVESPFIGLPCIFQRNPSLERGSMQRVYITKVKADVNDPTVSMQIQTIKGYNADFDGDEMNGTLLLDIWSAEKAENLAPHKSTIDTGEPRKISGNMAKSKPSISNIAAYLEEGHGLPPDPIKQQRMLELLS